MSESKIKIANRKNWIFHHWFSCSKIILFLATVLLLLCMCVAKINLNRNVFFACFFRRRSETNVNPKNSKCIVYLDKPNRTEMRNNFFFTFSVMIFLAFVRPLRACVRTFYDFPSILSIIIIHSRCFESNDFNGGLTQTFGHNTNIGITYTSPDVLSKNSKVIKKCEVWFKLARVHWNV